MTWIAIGIVTVAGFIVLVPLLVVGSWFVIINAILGLVDGTTWLMDQMWGTVRGKRRPGVDLAGSTSPTFQLALERK